MKNKSVYITLLAVCIAFLAGMFVREVFLSHEIEEAESIRRKDVSLTTRYLEGETTHGSIYVNEYEENGNFYFGTVYPEDYMLGSDSQQSFCDVVYRGTLFLRVVDDGEK